MSEGSIWACPVCGAGLELTGRTYKCANRHTYDLAAKGYVNLLLVNQRKSKDPGDSRPMLAARRNILEAGYFRKLSDELSRRAADLAGGQAREGGSPFDLLEAGCGEGYYLECAKDELRKRGVDSRLYGIDISRDAVTMAAGHNPEIHYAVASSRHLPVLSDSVDCIYQIFAPHSDQEFNRVLRKCGKLITVTPGAYHLYGVKELLYPKPYLNDEVEHPYPSFVVQEKLRIQDELVLTDPAAIRDLVMMTPYYWKTDPAMLEKLNDRNELQTQLDFVVTIYAPC
jgi:23S rRNA (guanine745-N1)-methyltransferase